VIINQETVKHYPNICILLLVQFIKANTGKIENQFYEIKADQGNQANKAGKGTQKISQPDLYRFFSISCLFYNPLFW